MSSSPPNAASSADDSVRELNEIAAKMRGEGGVEIRDRRHRLRNYKKCFVGSDAITWLVEKGYTHTRADAVALGTVMISTGIVAHVLRDHRVMEDGHLFYRFTCDEEHGSAGPPPDSPAEAFESSNVSWAQLFGLAGGDPDASPNTIDGFKARQNVGVDNQPSTINALDISPMDKHNVELLDKVHPVNWNNPTASSLYDLVVIGAGAGGLVSAAAASGVGARVALIEENLMGGDCLNVGCVPSKAILHAAKQAAMLRKAASDSAREEDGVYIEGDVRVDFGKVMERMRRLRAEIADNDSAARFATKLGVDVFIGRGRFTAKNMVEVLASPPVPGLDSEEKNKSASSSEPSARPRTALLKFVRCIIATGGSPSLPNIKGLRELCDQDYAASRLRIVTNENLFNLTELPERMGVIGVGPVGVEMAQAFQRLGSKVTSFGRQGRILSKEDVDAAKIVQEALEQDGVEMHLNVQQYEEVREESPGGAIVLTVTEGGAKKEMTFDVLLVAAGRLPNVRGLGLEEAGVDFDLRAGVKVNNKLQTSNSVVYAVGDVCSPVQFTHASDFMARMAVRNALFFGKDSFASLLIPWATYTSPEVARVGLSAEELVAEGTQFTVFEKSLEDNDRAILEGEARGFVRFFCKKGSDTVLGATIVGPRAGDLISEITVAMMGKVGLSKLASAIHPYPTVADAIRACGDEYNRTRLTPMVKSVLRTVIRLQRTGKARLPKQ